MNLHNKEIETRGKVLALSLKIEDSLNRILYNFFAQRSKDQETKSLFLQTIILPLSFGQKISLYKQILKTGRYQGKILSKLKTEKDFPVSDLNEFIQLVQKNLSQIVLIRNYIAHGNDISDAFLALEEDEVVFMKKADIMKVSGKSLEEFSNLIYQTYILLDITHGDLIDRD